MTNKALHINFVAYLGFLEPDVVDFSGRKTIYEDLKKANAVVHPNEHEVFLYTHQLSDDMVVEIINETIENIEVKNYEDELEAISGGFLLQYGDTFIIPQCCTDITDASLWKDVPHKQASDWTQVWIGHPYIYYRIDKEHIYFSDYTETEKELAARLVIPLNDFENALRIAFQQLEAYKKRVYQLIDAGDYEQKELLKERIS